MSKKTVAVLFGGQSSEYGVSLQSALSVLKNINRGKYDVIPIGITVSGDWYRFTGDIDRIGTDDWWENVGKLIPVTVSVSRSTRGLLELHGARWSRVEVDAVFPVLHGRNGEDGTVQGMLELAGIPVIGCGTLASAVGMDKERAHVLAKAAGVAVPRSVGFVSSNRLRAARRAVKFGFPLFVKPVRAGSSFGVTRVDREEDLPPAMDEALRYDSRAVIEKAVPGFEVGCAVMGKDQLTVGRVDEIELAGGFFDFQEKYDTKTAKLHMPARIPAETEKRIQDTAKTVYRALDCSGFARVDMFLTPEQDIVFNEVNTIPGLTSHSRFPAMMSGVGIDFPDMLDRLLEMYI